MPYLKRSTAHKASGGLCPHYSGELVFAGKCSYDLGCAGTVLINQDRYPAVERLRSESFGDDGYGFLSQRISDGEPDQLELVRWYPPKPAKILTTVTPSGAFLAQAASDGPLVRRQVAHEAEASDSAASVPTELHDQPDAS